MMAKVDEILEKVIEATTELKDIKLRLYGEEGDRGDIPTIRDDVKAINSRVVQNMGRITTLEVKSKLVWKVILAVLGTGGGATAIWKALEAFQ